MFRRLTNGKFRVHCWLKLRRHLSDAQAHSPSLYQSGFDLSVAKGDLRPGQVNVLPQAKYGGISHITLLTGNTIIGKQGANYISSLLQSARVPLKIQPIRVDQDAEYLNSVLRTRASIHIDTLHDAETKEKALKICNDLDLYVFMVRTRTFPGFNCRFPDVDIQLISQNNMGNYSELEYAPVPGVVEALRVVSTETMTRFLRFAFRNMIKMGRKRAVIVHKCGEWPVTDGGLVELALELQRCEFDDIELEMLPLDACVARLILQPNYFDTLIANDRYATFLATICSGVCGGANLFSSIEIGDNHAVFKPLQTKLSLTNYKLLSPYGLVSTCVDLLNYLNQVTCAKALWQQMLRTMGDGIKTVEFGGKDTGEYVVCNIMNKLRCDSFGFDVKKTGQ